MVNFQQTLTVSCSTAQHRKQYVIENWGFYYVLGGKFEILIQVLFRVDKLAKERILKSDGEVHPTHTISKVRMK